MMCTLSQPLSQLLSSSSLRLSMAITTLILVSPLSLPTLQNTASAATSSASASSPSSHIFMLEDAQEQDTTGHHGDAFHRAHAVHLTSEDALKLADNLEHMEILFERSILEDPEELMQDLSQGTHPTLSQANGSSFLCGLIIGGITVFSGSMALDLALSRLFGALKKITNLQITILGGLIGAAAGSLFCGVILAVSR